MQDQYINIRVDRKLKREIEKLAEKDERALSSYCKKVLREHVAKQK